MSVATHTKKGFLSRLTPEFFNDLSKYFTASTKLLLLKKAIAIFSSRAAILFFSAVFPHFLI